MWDGLIEIILSALQAFFCWVLQTFFLILGILVSIISSILPHFDVPEFLQGGLQAFDSILQGMNWIFPLGLVGFLFNGMLTYYFVLFVAVPIYRAIMDLL